MSTVTAHKRDIKDYQNKNKSEYEPAIDAKSLTGKAKERYLKVHEHEAVLRQFKSYHTTHYRTGKPYSNYVIRLPKPWGDGLDLHNHDVMVWSIVSYDPVILQLRKIEDKEDA